MTIVSGFSVALSPAPSFKPEFKAVPHAVRTTVPPTHGYERDARFPQPTRLRLDGFHSYDELVRAAEMRVGDLFKLRSVAEQARDDAELPPVNDPVRVAQSRQATAYIRQEASSPFAATSQEHLAEIMFDNTGAYTINERLAAHREAGDRHYEWSVQYVARNDAAMARGAPFNSLDREVQSYYAQLPPLQVAFMLGELGRASRVLSKILPL